MKRIADWSINRKLSTIILVASGVLIVTMATFVTIEKYFSFRHSLRENITAIADIIGTNSTAALTFQDRTTAAEILAALQAEHNIISACLYESTKEVFAVYHNPKHPQAEPICQVPEEFDVGQGEGAEWFSANYFYLYHPILLNQKAIGFIAIRADLSSINRQIGLFVLGLAGFSSLLFFVVLFVCSKLNRSLITPITTLVNNMQRVSREQNYTIRVPKKQEDELGLLIDGFNEMLAQIEKRDQELAHHRHQLADMVEQRTRELSRSNAKLLEEIEERKTAQNRLAHAQKMEAIGTLAGGVAHDLNNILSGVVSYPDLLIANLEDGSAMRGPLETIKTSGKKAAAIVQDLLTLARRGVRVEESVDLVELIQNYLVSPECTELLRNHPGVKVSFVDSAAPSFLRGSPLHLEKMLMNLIANAAEAMTNGGKIDIDCQHVVLDEPPPDFPNYRPGPYVELIIVDNGIGIPRQFIDRIFEPFYTRKVMGRSGTGLGMAVVWGTVEDHDGHISVESTEGVGTTIRILLPLAEAGRSQQQKTTGSEIKKGLDQTVLVVDDSEEQRAIAANILEYLGYQVETMASGEEAVEHLRAHRVDLVLLDMLMDPGIDGLETYKQMLAVQPDQKAIIASGFSMSERVKEAMTLGVSDYITKPYTLADISRAIHQTLHN